MGHGCVSWNFKNAPVGKIHYNFFILLNPVNIAICIYKYKLLYVNINFKLKDKATNNNNVYLDRD